MQFNALAKSEILLKTSDEMNLQKMIFLLIVVSMGTIFIATQFQNQENFAIQVNDSGPHIGTNIPYSYGYDGSGIIISVIDTGVDFSHPDLFGFDMDGKIIGGYDLLTMMICLKILMVMGHR